MQPVRVSHYSLFSGIGAMTEWSEIVQMIVDQFHLVEREKAK